jgi:hypothetical protein
MAVTAQILDGDVQLTGIRSRIKVSGGVQPANTIEYKYLLKVIDVDGKLLAPPDPDAIAPDSAGEAEFNISGIVDQPVKAVFQHPASGPFVEYPTQAFSVKVQPGETYVDDDPNSENYGEIVEVWGTESSAFQFLKGGMSQRQIAMFEASDTNFYQTYLMGGKFLTHRPWGDFVHPVQPVKLWFIPVSAVSATYNVKAVYDDSSEEIYSTPVSLDPTKLYEFNCNPATLGITLEPEGKRVEYFDVWLEAGGSKISDKRRFTFDWKYCELPLFLLFANSIGGVDDVFMAGRMIDKFNLEQSIVQREPQPGDLVTDPTLITPNSLGQNGWIISTGYKTVTQMLHLRDLMVSRQKWFLYKIGTSYIVIPIIINNTSEELINRMKDDHEIDLDISEADKSQFSFDNRIF